MSSNFQKGYSNVLLIVLLVTGLITGLYLVRKPTNIFPKAYNTPPDYISNSDSNITISSNGKFGIAIDLQKIKYTDGREKDKTPNIKELQALSPGWVRFLYKPGYKIPDFPNYIKSLVVFNGESVPGVNWNGDLTFWKNYTDRYIEKLEDFIHENGNKIDAIEIWNEEDICHEIYCSKVPEIIYADMLKRAAAVTKQYNSNIKVIMGGLVTNDITWEDGGYLTKVIKADPNAFDQVDGIGLHPYGKTISDWCSCNSLHKKLTENGDKSPYYCTDNIDSYTGQEKCTGILPYGNLAESIEKYKAIFPSHVKLWITEIGIGSINDDRSEWQKEYMKMVFDYLADKAEVIIWYSWVDTITCGDYGESNCGLFTEDGLIKPAGTLFKTYSSPL